MLPKNHRLNLKKDFKWVASGKKMENPFFKLFIKEGSNPSPLVGVAVSSKEFKSAVLRNKVKRLTFQAAQNIYESLPRNLNLVIMPKSRLLTFEVKTLEEELKKCLKL